MKKKIILRPSQKELQASNGQTILEVCQKNRVFLSSKCGGNGSCTTCRIQVINGLYTPLTAIEKLRLSDESISRGMRLGCQIRILGHGEIEIPPDYLQSLLKDGLEHEKG